MWVSQDGLIGGVSGTFWRATGQRMGFGASLYHAIRRLRGPAQQVLLGNALQRGNPAGAVIQTRDVVKFFATSVQKGFACFLVDFFKRL